MITWSSTDTQLGGNLVICGYSVGGGGGGGGHIGGLSVFVQSSFKQLLLQGVHGRPSYGCTGISAGWPPPDSTWLLWVCRDHPRMATLRDRPNVVFADDQVTLGVRESSVDGHSM